MKKIYILLTRTYTFPARVIHALSGDSFTHVAIAFDRDMNELYSSARWDGIKMFPCGPCKENLRGGFYIRRRIPCILYELSVEDSIFERAKEEVRAIIDNQANYGFNIIGLLLCRLGIPFRRKSHFFCSQFVGEILARSGALTLPRDPCLLRPYDYTGLPELKLCFQGYTDQVIV